MSTSTKSQCHDDQAPQLDTRHRQ